MLRMNPQEKDCVKDGRRYFRVFEHKEAFLCQFPEDPSMTRSSEEQRVCLFQRFSEHISLYEPDKQGLFVCPLCSREFNREAVIGPNSLLSIAHIIPRSLGGRSVTLTCTPCNNDAGREMETALVERFIAEDWRAGVLRKEARMDGPFGDIAVEVGISEAENIWSIYAVPQQSNPANIESMKDYLNACQNNPGSNLDFSVSMDYQHRPSHAKATLYQSAFLLMFNYFGYEFVLHPHFAPILQGIHNPEAGIWKTRFPVIPEAFASSLLGIRDHAIVFLREPVAAILIVLRLQPRKGGKKGQRRVLGVLLPGLDSDSLPTEDLRDFKVSVVRLNPENLLRTKFSLRKTWNLVKAAN